MKVLLVGSGGREHALAWAIAKSPLLEKLYAVPGSDSISDFAETSELDVLAAARAFGIDLVVIGPEAPLARGLADELRKHGFPTFGPGKEAARLEASKSFAKSFMERHAIPTARSRTVASFQEGITALADFADGAAIKLDGLAGGKGVVVCETPAEGERTLERFFTEDRKATVLIEERLSGPEVSLLGLCDGKRFLALPPSSDHKRLLNGDVGPNTGGMGVIAPAPAMPPEEFERATRTIIEPTLLGLAADGLDFRGLLYIGLMMTAEGPKVLEYNCRFGDPETQAVLPLLDGDLLELLNAAAHGDLSGRTLPWSGAAITVVMASQGYPVKPLIGKQITGLDVDALVFHAGTRRDGDAWITTGGRVLGVTGLGDTHAEARTRAYAAVEKIDFEGRQYRRDIGANVSRPELAGDADSPKNAGTAGLPPRQVGDADSPKNAGTAGLPPRQEQTR